MILEVGKFYVTRGGEKVKVVFDYGDGEDCTFKDMQIIAVYVNDQRSAQYYAKNGQWHHYKTCHDIVKEYVPEYRQPDRRDVGKKIEVRDHENDKWDTSEYAGKLRGSFMCFHASSGRDYLIAWSYARVEK